VIGQSTMTRSVDRRVRDLQAMTAKGRQAIEEIRPRRRPDPEVARPSGSSGDDLPKTAREDLPTGCCGHREGARSVRHDLRDPDVMSQLEGKIKEEQAAGE